MRNLIFGINVTLDGCCDHTKGLPDQEVHDYFARLNREADVVLYGRKTYELMVPFWPDIAKNPTEETKRLDDFAQSFVSIPRILVFSRSLKTVEGQNTTLVPTLSRDEILKLKREPGKNILTGGVAFPSELMKLGLIDEIRLVVHPVVAGKGRRLFDEIDLPQQSEFKLVDSTNFKSGCVALRYLKT